MYDVGTLFVVEKETNNLAGILSRKDLLRSLAMGNNQDLSVALIMTRMPNIYVTYPEVPVMQAARLLSQHEIDTLPVVEKKGSKKIVGKISKTTLVNLLIEVGDKGSDL